MESIPLSTTTFESPSTERAARIYQWDKLRDTLNDRARMAWGGEIEEGITETVVALNMLGLRTRMSCEGHEDEASWQSSGPWVSFDAEDTDPAFRKLDELLDTFDAEHEPAPDSKLYVYDDIYGDRSGKLRLMVQSDHDFYFHEENYQALDETSKLDTFDSQQKAMAEFTQFLYDTYLETGFSA